MNVVPELRKSLVKAAARQAEPASSRRRRPRLAGVVLAVGAATALAVVGVVFVLSGGSSPPTASRPALTGRSAALLAAQRLLVQVKLPAGAAAVASGPRELRSPPQGELPSGAVDVHRFFLVRGDPQTVVNAIQSLNMRLRQNGGVSIGESSASASASGSASRPTFASESAEVSPVGNVRREVQVSAASFRVGRSAVRIDAQAYWSPPRPAYTLIPAGTRTIEVHVSGASATSISQGLKTTTRLSSGREVALVVGFLNALPIAPRKPQASGVSCGNPRIRINFNGAGGRPEALAIVHPPCGLIDVWTGHTHTVLTFDAPVAGFKAGTLYQVLGLLVGVP
jgi:hypothetical protein